MGGLLLGALLLLAPAAGARRAADLSLQVTFNATDGISVTLPDGTPVGVTSGAPTVIPAGYYTIHLSGPLNVPSGMPYFNLTGPGVDVLENMSEGGVGSLTDTAFFVPLATYTWTNNSLPGVVYTFTASAAVLGTPPATPVSPRAGTPAASQDIVGSGAATVSGTLKAGVAPSGLVSLELGGKSVARLTAGRYRIVVTDRSASHGFVLERAGHRAVTVSSSKFVGRHSVTVALSAGRWLYASGSGSKSFALVVHAV
ncbi:MAG TPA: hypothetical protein VH063_11415 [Gaiellaceae bacterium]|jgi:hypothetical protein|nr:hypothetical protein [Gaiellaceae bacterium]